MVGVLFIEASGQRFKEEVETLHEARKRARNFVSRYGSNNYSRERTEGSTRYYHYSGDREAVVFDPE